ncbi:hypothetical protein HCN44_003519 [Aphidius gifuensis]|uniref:LITAF domain-containing protein n=2 Tax=Aphidius gifuensis TaxID=684658 RepID=A0A834XIP2_APHGI|nr:hypothetical protein HCN44_003519 [Aphidius gifuensis]
MEKQAPPPYNYEAQHMPMPMPMAVPAMNPYNQHASTSVDPIVRVAPMVTPLDKESTRMICPHCRVTIETTVEKNPSTMAWISSLILCLTVGYCGCCLIPFCMDDCHDVKHTCPSCGAFLGERRA